MAMGPVKFSMYNNRKNLIPRFKSFIQRKKYEVKHSYYHDVSKKPNQITLQQLHSVPQVRANTNSIIMGVTGICILSFTTMESGRYVPTSIYKYMVSAFLMSIAMISILNYNGGAIP